MTAPATPAAVSVHRTPGETLTWAWDVYRASQQAPWTGDRMGAQSRLFHELDRHALTGHRCTDDCGCNLIAVTVAALDLAALLPADGRES